MIDFKLFRGFNDEQTDICTSGVSFATENCQTDRAGGPIRTLWRKVDIRFFQCHKNFQFHKTSNVVCNKTSSGKEYVFREQLSVCTNWRMSSLRREN